MTEGKFDCIVPSEPLTLQDSNDQDVVQRYSTSAQRDRSPMSHRSASYSRSRSYSRGSHARDMSSDRQSQPLYGSPPVARSVSGNSRRSRSRTPPRPRSRSRSHTRRRSRSPSRGYHSRQGGNRAYSRSRSPRRRVSRDRRSYRSRSPSRSYRDRRSAPSDRQNQDNFARRSTQESKTLGVFALNFRTTRRDLEDLFAPYGEVSDVAIIAKRNSRRNAFAFVTLDSIESASEAREALNATEFQGSIIRVDFSMTDGPRNSTPGFYAGVPTGSRNRRDNHYQPRPYRRGRSRSRSYSRSRSPRPSRRDRHDRHDRYDHHDRHDRR